MRIDPQIRTERAKKANLKRTENARERIQTLIESGDWEVLNKSQRRTRILREQDFACAMCKTPQTWNEQPLNFDLDHINGDRSNESRQNLRLVCPNCHSQTPTYKSKNAGARRYSDEEIIDSLKKNDSMYKAMSTLGMNLHGGNYTRVRKIIRKYRLELPYLMM